LSDSYIISLKKISKIYDSRSIGGLREFSLDIKDREIISIVGPSGCGKTTLLSLIAGTLKADAGSVDIQADHQIALLAQGDSLDPQKTVYENIAAEVMFIADEERRMNQVRQTLATLELTSEIHRLPHQISGGQQQRAIIAKSLVKQPKIILMDEPFEHLDNVLRFELVSELIKLFKEQKITVVWVTHDTTEAMSFSDRIALINYGKLIQLGNAEYLYQNPNSLFTAQFFGKSAILVAKLKAMDKQYLQVEFWGDVFQIKAPLNFGEPVHGDILVVIRPEHIQLNPKGQLSGKILHQYFQGGSYLLQIKYKDGLLWAYSDTWHKGTKITFDVQFQNLIVTYI
jgi:ABC-type sugar transport system ATPase subunit